MHHLPTPLPSRPKLTIHARRRAQQRGIKEHLSILVFNFADLESKAGSGCWSLRLSSGQIRLLVQQGFCTAQEAERLSRLTLVTDGMNILTQFRAH
jgi:hypothetical protein